MIGVPDTVAATRALLLRFYCVAAAQVAARDRVVPVLTDVGHPPAGTTEHRPGQGTNVKVVADGSAVGRHDT